MAVSQLASKPLLLFAPGAGAPSTSAWMQRYAALFGTFAEVMLLDYPYVRAGRRAPDPLPKLIAAHQQELTRAREGQHGKVVLIGKSMGGRVGCHVALQEAVSGVVCLGYPLKAAGKSGKLRDQVLIELRTPILFVQGTRDPLCPLEQLAEVRPRMLAPNTLHVVEGGDHSLCVTAGRLKTQNLTQEDVERQILDRVQSFIDALPA